MWTKRFWTVLLAVAAVTPAMASDSFLTDPGKPATQIVDGKYKIGINTFLSESGFRVFTWHDGKQYVSGGLRYSNMTLSYQLPLVKAESPAGNHFTAEGKAVGKNCQYDVKLDIYSYESKVYAAVYGPDTSACGTSDYSWERYEEPFNLQVPPPPPVKPTCACKEVRTVDNQLLCTLPEVRNALAGPCTTDTCNKLISQANGACVAPSAF